MYMYAEFVACLHAFSCVVRQDIRYLESLVAVINHEFRQSSRGSVDYLDNVMTKSVVNNMADANCPLSLVDASHKLQIHVFVRLLTMKISQ